MLPVRPRQSSRLQSLLRAVGRVPRRPWRELQWVLRDDRRQSRIGGCGRSARLGHAVRDLILRALIADWVHHPGDSLAPLAASFPSPAAFSPSAAAPSGLSNSSIARHAAPTRGKRLRATASSRHRRATPHTAQPMNGSAGHRRRTVGWRGGAAASATLRPVVPGRSTVGWRGGAASATSAL